jgi:hypothetical protein
MTALKNDDKRIFDSVKRVVDSKLAWHTKNNNMVFARSATVTAYNGTTKVATVYFAGDSPSNTTDLQNKSGESLSNTDEVYVFCIGSLMNAYIAIKK